ncbi:MAG: methylenetetrahydrofolate--tRNA-(uracil(54)-C(5))-methyltransferase (FADH(2)-oxidizing) TrmFO [Vulcanimicrobiota bacterium]
MKKVKIIGAGLAGSEAAYQLARRNIPVQLYEMRPATTTPVHKTGLPGELVCSNSLGSDNPESAPGLLKREMELFDSLIIKAARETRVPAGQALAVDRIRFSKYIEDTLNSFPHVEIINEEITEIPTDSALIIASGPLTSQKLADSIKNYLGHEHLYFFDAVSPVIEAESINMEKAFIASRYDKGTPDYLNCSMSQEEYLNFYNELISAQKIEVKDFEKKYLFEGCMPVEDIAACGVKSLVFGPMKPVGLDENAEAVVQLRKEDREGSMYSLVGFQTRLKWGEQKRIIRLIPGLEKAEIVRYGVMHKNIFINSPEVLYKSLQLKENEKFFIAGQITGVEGYVESTAMGLVAGINLARVIKDKKFLNFPRETAIGSLINYITEPERKRFQPMNINFGVLPSLKLKMKKKEKRKIIVENCYKTMKDFVNTLE